MRKVIGPVAEVPHRPGVMVVPSSTAGALRRVTSSALAALAVCVGCDADARYADPSRTYADASLGDGATGAVRVHVPASLTSILGTVDDPQGHPVEVRCATCHAVLQPPPALPTRAQDLGGPHAGMHFAHGDNACRACHDPERYDRLRLATGESVPMTDAMRLCAQCHGPQRRDWLHGAHGGMNGHWDLRRGSRVRNHCVDCHDPHAPRFPSFLPMPPPRDSAHPEGDVHE